MDYPLKNGKTVSIRVPVPEDAAELLQIIAAADTQTRFLARNPGELSFTVEQEAEMIRTMQSNPDHQWFVAEYQGRLVGNCSAGLVSTGQRFRHRAGVAFALLQEYWGLGIGGKMMEHCLAWCREHNCRQVELDVVAGNNRALSMYKSFGFQSWGTKPRALRYPDGSCADEYYMVKFL